MPSRDVTTERDGQGQPIFHAPEEIVLDDKR
jgi:hypothetical protein